MLGLFDKFLLLDNLILRVTNIADVYIIWMTNNRTKISAGHFCCRDHKTPRAKILHGKHDYWGINYLGRQERGRVNVASQIASPPLTKMTSKDDIKGLAPLKFLRS